MTIKNWSIIIQFAQAIEDRLDTGYERKRRD
jgi:hypothetical protein